MSSTASAAFATSSAVRSAAEAASAHKAKVERCTLEIDQFDSRTATVEEMKSYADCVNTIYPDEMNEGTVIGLKILFVILLIGIAFGLFKDRNDDLETKIAAALCFGIGFPILALCAAGIFYGIAWLFA